MEHYNIHKGVELRTFIFLFLTISSLYSIDINEIKSDIKYGKYEDACNKAGLIFGQNSRSETYLNLFAFSCIKAGFLDRVFLSIVNLTRTKDARDNALYYQTLLYKKSLIVAIILDKKDYSSMVLPKTNHILDTIFSKLQAKEYKIESGIYKIKEGDTVFEVGVVQHSIKNTLFINRYVNSDLVKSYIFK